MSNELSIIIVGAYTLVYLIVFFIQKAQISKNKEVISSMKSFMEIFKVDEVKKYVELKSERIMMQATDMIVKDESIKKAMKDITNEKVDEIKSIYMEQMGEEHLELVEFAINVISSTPKERREELINKGLPKTKRYFDKILKDINEDED
ncbi:hypothetical protein RQM59_07490 [Flavobacteriaceae bacterium S356]|uniref:Uncharacterized protein n=1 Tax=Asprobacillus argus TaxID=3076534 RepID=A0ABU3LF54_9FLAO|nr:hypothetical protein [Flavobacteriaceae bacterium S356]